MRESKAEGLQIKDITTNDYKVSLNNLEILSQNVNIGLDMQHIGKALL